MDYSSSDTDLSSSEEEGFQSCSAGDDHQLEPPLSLSALTISKGNDGNREDAENVGETCDCAIGTDIVSDEPDPKQTESSSVGKGGLSPEEKEKRKILNKASKKLLKLNRRLISAMEDTVSQEKTLDKELANIEHNKKEVRKVLADHVKYLHSLVEYYHKQEEDLLTQRHKQFLQQILVAKTEGLNFRSKMADLQKKVEASLSRIFKDRDVKAANAGAIDALCSTFNSQSAKKPNFQISTLTYTVEIPQVTADDLQTLLGRFHFSDNSKGEKALAPGHSASPSSSQGSLVPWKPSHGTPAKSQAPDVGLAESPSSSQRPASVTGKKSKKSPSKRAAKSSPSAVSQSADDLPSLSLSKEDELLDFFAPSSSLSKSTANLLSLEMQTGESDPSTMWPHEASTSLGTMSKASDIFASTTSLASSCMSTSSALKKAKRARRRSRRKRKAAEAKAEAQESLKPLLITLLHGDARPKRIEGRKVEAKGFAVRPGGEVWVVYGSNDPHLDLLREDGKILESTRIGGNAINAASFSDENVLISFHSPCVHLQLLDADKKTRETFNLPMVSTGLGVGSTGIAVSGKKSLYWIPLDGGVNQWIVKEKGSTLKNVCSCDVILVQGREIVCLADKEGHKVWFFEKLENSEFAPLPLFTYSAPTKDGSSTPFSPICVSALAGTSFVAVLDSASRSVIMVDVEKNKAMSVIPRKDLCTGEPTVIGFALTPPEEEPKLWVGSSNGFIFLVSLMLLY